MWGEGGVVRAYAIQEGRSDFLPGVGKTNPLLKPLLCFLLTRQSVAETVDELLNIERWQRS